MQKRKIVLVFLISLTLFNVVSVNADELIIPEFKYSSNTIFTLLGIRGESYIAIQDNIEIQGESKFLLAGFKTTTQNKTFIIEVYSDYQEYYDENNTLRVNSSLINRKEINVYSNNFQELIDIDDYNEFVTVKIFLENTGVGFIFEFQTVWDFQTVTKTNLQLLQETFQQNFILIFMGAIACIVLSIAILDRIYLLPGAGEKQMLPVVWFGISLSLMLIGYNVRPPNLILFSLGAYVLLTEFVMYSLSAFLRKNMNFLLFDDPIKEETVLIYVYQKQNDIIYINYLSYLDLFFRIFAKERILEVRSYLRRLSGKIKYKIYAKNVELPDFEIKMSDNVLYQFILLFAIAFVFVIAVIFDFPVLLLLIILFVIIYFVSFVKVKTKEFKAEFYPKSSIGLFAESLAERCKEIESKIAKEINIIETEIKKSKKIDDKVISTLRKCSNNILTASINLKSLKNDPEALIKELRVLDSAGSRIEKLIQENDDLRRRVLIGSALNEIRDILTLEEKLYPTNFEEKFADEFKKVENKIFENKKKSKTSENLEIEKTETLEGKKEQKGGSVIG